MTEQAYILRVSLTHDLEYAKGCIGRIISALQKPSKLGMHTKRGMGFVIRTAESLEELVNRLRPTLDEIEMVENWWCHRAPPVIMAKYGSMDSLTTRVSEVWAEVRQRRHSKYVRDSEPR